MNDCLTLPLRQGGGGIRRLGAWEAVWLALGEGEAERLPAGSGEGWEPIGVPAQQWAREDRSAIWYRTRFPRPDHDGRVVLRVGGAFLGTNVWLNGRFLGSHYGYFAPFGFDVTPFLREENLLVICCESPIETDLARKRHVMGVFNDGDSRPYPSSAWFSLPDEYRWEVPVGLWRPVELEYTGPVVLDSVRLRPRVEAGDVGRLEVVAHLRNLDGREMPGEVVVELDPPSAPPSHHPSHQPGHGSADQRGAQDGRLRLRREFVLAGATEKTVEMTMTVPHAERWSPWRAGEQALYGATIRVLARGRESVRWDDHFGFRDLAVNAGPEGWSFLVNGQPMFLRGANYLPSLQLDQLTEETFKHDLELARDANLDVLRVHGHVLPEEFYRLADEVGMLVIADFALTLSYAYHATAEETRFFETAVRSQLPEMVGLLCNRPSIILWVAHDDPPWIAGNAALGDVHAVRQNYTIDQELKATLERLDPSRTALAASGELDQHLWLGWREGGWHQFGDVLPGFVSEFGAQALPDTDSPVWETLGRHWPVDPEDPRWLYAGFQHPAWAERGVGLPSDWDSLEEYVEAGQEYQAWLCAYAIDQFRKLKFEPCWGAVVYTLGDAFPGVGFGLVDASGRPKAALEAVKEAFAPLRLILDPVGFTPLVPFGVGWHPVEQVAIRLVVVNDDPELEGAADIRWSVSRDRPLEGAGLSRMFDVLRRKSYGGGTSVELPAASEPALQVETLTLPLDAEGDYLFEAELRVPGREPVRSELTFRVAEVLDTARRRPLLPSYVADRIVVPGSLRQTEEGVCFTLRNRTRPAVLTALGDVRLDGMQVTQLRVLQQSDAGRIPLPRRVELPVDREVVILIELGERMTPGEHELEVDLTMPGVASGRVRIKGRIEAAGAASQDAAPSPSREDAEGDKDP
ncbi:MAG TPA: glycoside hydrolase family 2 TIM barrel-domain containing protein [Candidatus Binatia bacterium]|nr:glycoside hydrolase family 2 TIM barrel-domain containing protein [Candidatus Binatia bacterium]